jgi:8-oxo-dGTP diphosphatase
VIASVRFCPRCGQPIAQQLKFGKMRPVCPACGYIHFDDPKVAVVVFVEQDGKVLLILRGVDPQRGKWAFPAGYVDRGEDPAQAAVREMAEETGLSVEITRLIDVTFDNGIIVIMYAAQVVGGALQAQDDADDARWFGPADLPELAFRSTQVLITAWSCKRDKSRE